MNLFQSLITTALIVTAVWTVALFQPITAIAGEKTSEETSAKPTQSKVVKNQIKSATQPFKDLAISGISQTIALDQLSQLWLAFNDNKKLHNKLKQNPSKTYVYYQNFSSNYDSAKVTIGYDAKELTMATKPLKLSDAGFELLLKKAKYSNQQLRTAWDNIDYRRTVVGILEVHHLTPESTVSSSEIYVLYQ